MGGFSDLNTVQQAAIAYINVGLSVLPTRQDKIPAVKGWKSRMATIPTENTIRNEFKNGDCVAIVCGKVSGNLECIDFDFGGKRFSQWMDLVDNETPGLIDRLVIQETQNGGFHCVYRCSEPIIEGSQKLAGEGIEVPGPGQQEYQGKRMDAVERNGKHFLVPCYIETRGEGGYFLCYPSENYKLTQGKFSQVPTITADERNVLISAARALNRWIPEPRREPTGKKPAGGLSPGDDYKKRGDIPGLFLNHGWTPTGRQATGGEHWRRPGKDKGQSATLFDNGNFYVFTSNASPFEAEQSYSPLAIYTLLEHSGDYTAAVRELARQGYGESRERQQVTSEGERTGTQPKNLTESMGGFSVPKKYVDGIGSEEFLIDNLLIKNHILTVIGESGAGKTAFFYFHGARHMAERGAKVYYVDADSPPSDHKKMMAYREQHGFNWIIPDVNEGKSVDGFKKTLLDLADRQESLEDAVFIFDTLKKFVNTMSKDSIKTFYTLMRRLTKLGATVALLGHANKYRDGDGNLIFEGCNDIKSDSDELIFFSHQSTHDKGTDVTTMIDPSVGAKVRGLFKPFSFHINQYREISFYDQVKTPIELSNAVSRATDSEILDVTAEYLTSMAEPVRQNRLIEYVCAKVQGSAGVNRVRKLIVQCTVKKGEHQPLGTRFVYTVGDRNIHFYEMP